VSKSLSASELGKQLIKQALDLKRWTPEDLSLNCDDSKVTVSRSTAYDFASGSKKRPEKFRAMCDCLGLDWEVVAGLKSGKEDVNLESPPSCNYGRAEPVEQDRSTTGENLHKTSNEAQDIQAKDAEYKYHDCLQQLYPENLSQIADNAWQQSVRRHLTVQLEGDNFLYIVKQVIDHSIANKELQHLLGWIQKQANPAVEQEAKSVARRAFYLTMVLDPIGVIACKQALDIMLGLAQSQNQRHINSDKKISCMENHIRPLPNPSSSYIHLDINQALDRTLNACWALQTTKQIISLYLGQISQSNEFRSSGLARTLDPVFSNEITCIISDLKNNLYDYYELSVWWSLYGKAWAEKLENIINEYCDLIEVVQGLTHKQQTIIRQYFDANIFLVELLEIENAASLEVREEIKGNLLLPIVELKRRFPDQYAD
jgi:predicted DNA-binding protein YlxM (UPF0122 family)